MQLYDEQIIPGQEHVFAFAIGDGNGLNSLDSIFFSLTGNSDICSIEYLPWSNVPIIWDEECFQSEPLVIIEDAHPRYSVQFNFKLKWSSIEQLGEEKFKLFLSKIGVVEQINFDIEETGTPIKFNWGKCPLATASFGHGITTTLLQLAKAYSIIVNGGYDINPSLLMNSKKKKKEKILDEEVSRKILPILRKIVTTKEETASLANVNGYEGGGKTGTAEKSFKGSYSKKKINSFVAIFPTTKPRFVLAVMLDEPKTNENYIYQYRDGSNIKYKGTPFNTAGWTTVEVTGQILEKIGPILATKYSEVN